MNTLSPGLGRLTPERLTLAVLYDTCVTMRITAGLLDGYVQRLVGPFHVAAERHGAPMPHTFVVRSDSVAYGIGYASQMLEQDGRVDLAWRALLDAADETNRQLEEYGWIFTAEEAEELRIASGEIRQFIAEHGPQDVVTGAAAPV